MRKLDLLDRSCLSRRDCISALLGSGLVACTSTIIHEVAPRPDSGALDASEAGDAGDETVTCTVSGHDVGPATSFPQGTWKEVGSLIIGHDAKGLFAFSAICTHAGCVIDPPLKNGSTSCPCHGSQFDGNGAVTAGPAASPLEHYSLELCNGNVLVDTSSVVPAATRTPAV